MSNWRIVATDLHDRESGTVHFAAKSLDHAEAEIQKVYKTGAYNHWTFLIQNYDNGTWWSVDAWTIGDYLDGETNFGK